MDLQGRARARARGQEPRSGGDAAACDAAACDGGAACNDGPSAACDDGPPAAHDDDAAGRHVCAAHDDGTSRLLSTLAKDLAIKRYFDREYWEAGEQQKFVNASKLDSPLAIER